MAKKRPTVEEKKFMTQVAEFGCVACHIDGHYKAAEIHHIRNHTGLGIRPDHSDILPLCPEHHRTGKVSVHLGKQAFIEKYGQEQTLAKMVRERIKQWNEIVDIF